MIMAAEKTFSGDDDLTNESHRPLDGSLATQPPPPPPPPPLTREQHGDDDPEASACGAASSGDDAYDVYKSPAPDGGLTAWLALLSSWCMLFCTFGMINCAFFCFTTRDREDLGD